MIQFSFGSGIRITPEIFPWLLLAGADFHCRVRSVLPTPEAVARQARSIADGLIAIANGQPVSVTAVVGIAGAAVQTKIAFDDTTTLIAASQGSAGHLPWPTASALLLVEQMAKARTDEEGHGFGEVDQGLVGTIESTTRDVQLAVLLGGSSSPPSALASLGQTWLTPLSGIGAGSWGRTPPAVYSPATITPTDQAPILEWWSRVRTASNDHPNIAIDRVLNALSYRTNAEDTLVDAVVAWESLFATHSGELVFRIAASIAWLLEPRDAVARTALFREVKRIYDVRSKVVHGATIKPGAALPDKSEAAVRIAVECLRVLYRDRRDLLGRTDRAEALLLGDRPRQADA